MKAAKSFPSGESGFAIKELIVRTFSTSSLFTWATTSTAIVPRIERMAPLHRSVPLRWWRYRISSFVY